MDSFLYDCFRDDVQRGRVNLERGDICLVLVHGYEPSPKDSVRDDVTYEIESAPVPNCRIEGGCLYADSVVWPLSFKATGAVLYQDNGDEARDRLIGYLDFGGEVLTDGVEWPDGKVMELRQ